VTLRAWIDSSSGCSIDRTLSVSEVSSQDGLLRSEQYSCCEVEASMSIMNPRFLLNPLPSYHALTPESCTGYPDDTACLDDGVGVWIGASSCTSDAECASTTAVCHEPCCRCTPNSEFEMGAGEIK
jgi:hypothetical protein